MIFHREILLTELTALVEYAPGRNAFKEAVHATDWH